MRCSVKYSELYKQLIGLITIPLTLAAIYLLVMYLLKIALVSETILNIYSFGGSIIVVLLGIFILRKFILINAEVEYDTYGIYFQLKNNSFLYNETSVSVLYDNIDKISFDENDNYRVYVKIKTKLPKKTILISPDKYANSATFISYWSDVTEKVEQKKSK